MTASAPAELFLHASAAVVEGGAMLFLGHSTSGKSTIVRMLAEEFPTLADDAVFVARGRDGLWRVVDGGFRFGQGWDLADWQASVRRRAAAAAGVPVRGCWRLHKAPHVKAEPLEPIALARMLMDAAMEIDVQRTAGRTKRSEPPDADDLLRERESRRRWFQWVADIARRCPGWNLWFSKGEASAIGGLIVDQYRERRNSTTN